MSMIASLFGRMVGRKRIRLMCVLGVACLLSVFGVQQTYAAGYAWQQLVELGPSGGGTRATGWTTTQYTCDNDPDTDYVFIFQIDARNPDALRFYTTNALVANLPAQLNSYGYNFYEARVCVGDGHVMLAGGANNVFANLWLK